MEDLRLHVTQTGASDRDSMEASMEQAIEQTLEERLHAMEVAQAARDSSIMETLERVEEACRRKSVLPSSRSSESSVSLGSPSKARVVAEPARPPTQVDGGTASGAASGVASEIIGNSTQNASDTVGESSKLEGSDEGEQGRAGDSDGSDDPDGLPDDVWVRVIDEDTGEPYFFHKRTKTVSWEPP